VGTWVLGGCFFCWGWRCRRVLNAITAKAICTLLLSVVTAIAASENDAARNLFVNELGRVRDATGFRLIGYAVMPEHVHLLISEPREGTPSKVLHKLKLGVARKLRKRKRASAGQLRLPFAPSREPLRAFWQARFYDFNVYSRGKKREKLNYMHANPVKRACESSEGLGVE